MQQHRQTQIKFCTSTFLTKTVLNIYLAISTDFFTIPSQYIHHTFSAMLNLCFCMTQATLDINSSKMLPILQPRHILTIHDYYYMWA